MIYQWSYSRLKTYEGCPKQAFFRYVQKIKEPPVKAMERGKEIHKTCEEYIRGREIVLTGTLKDFEDGLNILKENYRKGHVLCEGDWAWDKDWNKTDWFGYDTWGRAKVDAFYHDDSTNEATVIDFKTGRYEGNQEGHREQCELYASICLLRYPELEKITTEMWYLDHNKIDRYEYDKNTIENKRKKLTERAIIMTTAEDFPAKPDKWKCRWCYFGKEGLCQEAAK